MLDTLAGPSEDYAFLGDGGEMGLRVANFDWGSTPLGPIESW